MHTRTYADKRVIRLTRHFACITVDPGKGSRAQRVCAKWRVGVERRGEFFDYPIAVLLDRQGRIGATYQGFVEPGAFAGHLRGFLEGLGAAPAPPNGGDGAPPAEAGPVAWVASYDEALDTSTFEEKPLLLLITEPGGKGDSARLLSETFADEAVRRRAADFVCVRLDGGVEDNVFVAETYQMDVEAAGLEYRLPLLVVLTPALDVLAVHTGFAGAEKVLAMLGEAGKKK